MSHTFYLFLFYRSPQLLFYFVFFFFFLRYYSGLTTNQIYFEHLPTFLSSLKYRTHIPLLFIVRSALNNDKK
ncbi:hypothetical protein RCL_jg7291.t1 [Rhizophagus clarus]|uniref:Uncharacterized protein n=1 Tax=Rhizophagus clarus TaxID=94130 RepID=A0A8H3QLG4_9GLOM|nr:hypothetical protein RCL_jg7291.t1 [Rhizophagus clarus]